MGIKTQNPVARFFLVAVITFLTVVIVWTCGVGMFRFIDKHSQPVPGLSPSPSTSNR